MDPLITNAIDPGLLRVLEKRGEQREEQQEALRRRKRPVPPEKLVEEVAEAENPEPGDDTPKHALDDLA
ncbi:MAG: hypothetical protein ACLPHI_20160 [Terriglobales bacterium]|jgi:hypothetical protein